MRVKNWLLWLALLPPGIALPVAGTPDTAILNWVNPTTYTDGTPLTIAIAQTNITCSAIIVAVVRSGCTLPVVNSPGTATTYTSSFTFTNTAGGSICWTVQTQLADGSVSAQSNEACKVEAPLPKVSSPATGLTVK